MQCYCLIRRERGVGHRSGRSICKLGDVDKNMRRRQVSGSRTRSRTREQGLSEKVDFDDQDLLSNEQEQQQLCEDFQCAQVFTTVPDYIVQMCFRRRRG